jgi:hypothetical protein
MRSAIVRIDESRVEVELIDLVKFRPEALGWHFRFSGTIHSIKQRIKTRTQAKKPIEGFFKEKEPEQDQSPGPLLKLLENYAIL